MYMANFIFGKDFDQFEYDSELKAIYYVKWIFLELNNLGYYDPDSDFGIVTRSVGSSGKATECIYSTKTDPEIIEAVNKKNNKSFNTTKR